MSHGKTVRTWARIRPTANFAHDILDLPTDGKTINIHTRLSEKGGFVNNQCSDWSFKLDGIFHNASQDQVYDTVSNDIVKEALYGINGTLLCYGQTGAGKTFTMTGATENYKHRGLIPRAIQQLYKEVEDRHEHHITIRVSYLEIYNETMYDLLSSAPDAFTQSQLAPLVVVEESNTVYVKGLSCHLAPTEEDALNMLFEGETNRAIAAHSLNQQSSRSHCVFTVYIESRSKVSSEVTYTLSKLNFVDLAGSERLGKTLSEGKTQQEAMYINKSLSFLEQTVIALADKGRDHVPFRQSKLTHCLKDSIGGNCNTILIANIWGEESQLEETISTLRFATRMMRVKVEPAIMVQTDPALKVKQLEKEILLLKRELAMHDTLANRLQVTYEPMSEQQRYDIRQQIKRYLDGEQEELEVVNIRQVLTTYELFKLTCLEMKTEIETSLRQRYTLVDKTDPAAIQAAQEAGLPINDQGELVGEPDGSGFGVGNAPSSAKAATSAVVQAKKKDAKKKAKERPGGVSPGPKSSSPSLSKAPTKEEQKAEIAKEEREIAQTPSSTGLVEPKARVGTPPPRAEAFEDFKIDAGSEIVRILNENKEIFLAKKKKYAQTAKQVNKIKADIDGARERLQDLVSYRESMEPMHNDDGDVIIPEAEFQQIQKIKTLKDEYKTQFSEVRALKAEVQYCQKLVDQCRQRLIQEFNNWYTEEYLPEGQGSQDSVKISPKVSKEIQPTTDIHIEDEQERYDRLQRALLLEQPDSAAYYQAKMRLHRRKTYEVAVGQPGLGPNRKPAPGTPVRRLRQQPNSVMQVM